jgi:hypothetical protein
MLQLPTYNKILRLLDVDSIMDSHGGEIDFPKDFTVPSPEVPTDLSTINITLLEEPYQDFSWFFA